MGFSIEGIGSERGRVFKKIMKSCCCGSERSERSEHTQIEEERVNADDRNNKASIKKLITIVIIALFAIGSVLMMHH